MTFCTISIEAALLAEKAEDVARLCNRDDGLGHRKLFGHEPDAFGVGGIGEAQFLARSLKRLTREIDKLSAEIEQQAKDLAAAARSTAREDAEAAFGTIEK